MTTSGDTNPRALRSTPLLDGRRLDVLHDDPPLSGSTPAAVSAAIRADLKKVCSVNVVHKVFTFPGGLRSLMCSDCLAGASLSLFR